MLWILFLYHLDDLQILPSLMKVVLEGETVELIMTFGTQNVLDSIRLVFLLVSYPRNHTKSNVMKLLYTVF